MVVFGVAGVIVEDTVANIGTQSFSATSPTPASQHSTNSQRSIGQGFRINPLIDAWWVEDFLAVQADPELSEKLAPTQVGVPVVGVAVEAAGSTSQYRAYQVVESVLGALWAMTWDDRWLSWPPTILGAPTTAEDPRSPDYEGDSGNGLLPIEVLQIDSRGRKAQPALGLQPANVDVNLPLAGKDPSLPHRVADAHIHAQDACRARGERCG